MILLALSYPLVCLLLGTLSGMAAWWREGLLHALCVVALGAAWISARRRQQWPLVGGWFEPALIGLFIVLALGTLNSPCPAQSWRTLLIFAGATAVFYLAAGIPHFSLCATATAAAMIGLAGYALGWTPRVAAPLGHHNYMAGFLLLHLPLVLEAAAVRAAWYLSAALIAVGIIFTGSLAAIVVLTLYGVRRLATAFRRRQLAAAVIVLVILGVGAAAVRTRAVAIFVQQRDPSLSFENRLRYIRTGLTLLAEKPLAGWGVASVPLVSAPYRPQVPGVMPAGEALRQLHNTPINLLAETGTLGALAAALLFVIVLRGARRAAAVAIAAYAIYSISDYQLDVPAILLPVAVISALALGQEKEAAEFTPAGRRIGLAALAGLLIVSVVLFTRATAAHYFFSRENIARARAWDECCGFYAFQAADYVASARRMPDLIPAATQAGSALVAGGYHRDAIPWLERAAALDYYNSLAHFHLGRARLRDGDRNGAISAFGASFLAQPATVLAEDWLYPPEDGVYVASVERAIDRLYELAASNPRSGPLRRWNELGSFLSGRRNLLPAGQRVLFFEVMDRDLAVNHSLILFRRVGRPTMVAPLVIALPSADFGIPNGIGAIEGLPAWRAR